MTRSFQHSGIRKLAYNQIFGSGPGVVFLGGFRSDKEGIKALHLETWAERGGRAYLRFDYSGHGQSSGDFLDGCIGDWAEDAAAIIANLTEGPQILVGSSMGGWISLLIAREMPKKVAGLVTIAAAPDFTEDAFWASLNDHQKQRLLSEGQIEMPSAYSEEPYIFTRRLIEEGRKQLVLRSPLSLPFPVRMLHGTADMDVDVSVALRLLEHAEGDDLNLTLVKGADHRFSDPDCLSMIEQAIEDVTVKAV
ncbi:alpha/beta hydrolase [Silicimonas sp. MF1-12-2]|uniref:alpha/beta hydrolase n=1 Tax=Silicimonas sp. MF1-12-2 TaxID=3384793 RepID=UPI0039B5F7AE